MTILLAVVDGRMRDETLTGHLSSEQLAAYLDGRLTGSDRDRAVRHFAGCDECRSELTELRGMLAATRPHSRRWGGAVAAVAAAAIVAVLTIPRLMNDGTGTESGRVRAADSPRPPQAGSVIVTVAPADQALVPASGVRLSWRSAGNGATYTVIVQDSSSNEVWRRTALSDTSIAIPDSVRLGAGRLFFWSVDARLADGNSAKTGAHTFIVR